MPKANFKSHTHESGEAHVSGEAIYIDDINTPSNTLHLALSLSPVAKGKILSINISKAKKLKGVKAIYTADDIKNLFIGAILHDEPLLAKNNIDFFGQAYCAVLATSYDIAKKSALLVELDYEEEKAIISIDEAIENNSYLSKPINIKSGNVQESIKKSEYNLKGEMEIGGQEHFYLEGQVCLALPEENNEITILSSTQNPSEVQHLVAHTLDVGLNHVKVITRRMGGGFGGKETDSSQIACLSALFCSWHKVAIKTRLNRYDDFVLTGKRHDYIAKYEVAFDKNGIIDGVLIDFYARCGYSLDLSSAIVSRTLFHADNAYYFKNVLFNGHLCKTNTVSNTAFRGFGGPQGMLVIENILDDVARKLKIDKVKLRTINYYKVNTKNITPYGQRIEDNILYQITKKLKDKIDYKKRVKDIKTFNQENKYLKKGLGFNPVKFGISFTTTFLNQAGALVNIYKDGSIYINHGGTEMGQGLFTKVATVVAYEFGLDISLIKSSATNTAIIPNTSPTAASAGTDMNAMAAKIACKRIKKNLNIFARKYYKCKKDISFKNGNVVLCEKSMTFKDFISSAYLQRCELFSNGFYKVPKIHYDTKTSKGRPFYYYSYGVAFSEIILDVLSGEYKLNAVDILHDVGNSLNEAIDMGQIIGGFIQGYGWISNEELRWNKKGQLITTGGATYKLPAIGDIPEIFNVQILQDNQNKENTIYKSKAVGEPPLMLAISSFLAIKDAISNVNPDKLIKLNSPATFERVFCAMRDQ